jgi:hypothetical protein
MVDLSRRKGEQMPWAQTLSTRLRLLHRRQALRILNQTGGWQAAILIDKIE